MTDHTDITVRDIFAGLTICVMQLAEGQDAYQLLAASKNDLWPQ